MSRISLFALTLGALVTWASAYGPHIDINKAPELFVKFQKDYHRVYKNAEDKAVHYKAFLKNIAEINKLNEKDPRAVYGINKFADYTEEDKKRHRGLWPVNEKREIQI